MFCLGRTLVRVGVVGALLVGAGVLIAGPDRISALWNQTRSSINAGIDAHITDPVAVRAQLRSLEGQYPQKIAQVRSDLAEVTSQFEGLTREKAVAMRVVTMAEGDLGTLTALVDQAQQAQSVVAMQASYDPNAPARRIEVLYNNQAMSVEEIERRAADVANTREAYSGRLGDIERDLGHLTKQKDRLAGLLTKLERERAEFQVQLWQLDRQVDSIARNDRMITVLKTRQETIDEASRYKVGSLDGLRTKLADIRSRQEGELASLAAGEERSDYESRAKQDLDRENARLGLPSSGKTGGVKKATEEVIRITPGSKPLPVPASPGSNSVQAPVGAPVTPVLGVSGEKKGG